MITVLIVDDHPLVCSALEAALKSKYPDARFILAHTAGEALTIAQQELDIDIVLLDLNLPDTEGFDGIREFRDTVPRIPILVLSGIDDARVIELVRGYGALGFLNKKADSDQIFDAVAQVLRGETAYPDTDYDADETSAPLENGIAQKISQLTKQQSRVLRLMGDGLLNKQIAYELSISESTVKAHVSAILKMLGASSRMQAVMMAQGGVFDQPRGLRAKDVDPMLAKSSPFDDK